MLQRRLTPATPIVIAFVATLTACAGIDGTERGAIRENVIEPGITAMDQSRSETCGVNAATLRTALEAFELLEGTPAEDEAALVAAGYLREETPDWDVVDGRVVAQDPSCGPVPDATPDSVVEIVTEPDDASIAVDDVYAAFSVEDVASMGGPECARQFAVVVSGASRFVDERGAEPGSLEEVDAAGLFVEPVTMWQIVDDVLRPANGSKCRDFVAQQAAADS